MASQTVLYVEDDEDDVFFLRSAFERMGVTHAIRTVSDGREAIAYLAGKAPFANREEHPLPAVVVLDLKLPVVSGFDVLSWMRKQPELNKVPVVIFSSSVREQDKQMATALGANHYVSKPLSGMDFWQVAENLKRNWLAAP